MSYRIKHTAVDRNYQGQIVDESTFDAKQAQRLIGLGAIEKTSDKATHDATGTELNAEAIAEKRDRAAVGLPDGDEDADGAAKKPAHTPAKK